MAASKDFWRLQEILNTEQLSRLFRFFSAVTGLDAGLFDFAGFEILVERQENSICKAAGNCSQCRERISYGGLMSSDLGEPYICSCGCGLIMCFLPVMFKDRLIGTIACGPVLLWEADEVAISEFGEKTQNMGLNIDAQNIFSSIVSCDCINLTSAAQILFIIVNSLTKEHSVYLDQRAIISGQQAKIAELIIEQKTAKPVKKQKDSGRSGNKVYPAGREKELIAAIESGNLEHSRAILNSLLGEIFIFADGKLDTIRTRIFELIAFVSRAALETGAPPADINAITKSSFEIFSEPAGNSPDFEKLCFLAGECVGEFIEKVFRNHEKKQLNIHLMKAVDYISRHYSEDLTLNKVSDAIFVSAFYLSHLFRNELNTTFSDYICRFRISMAKDFLRNKQYRIMEIARMTGFSDPNYFAKSFKKLTGVTPKSYRACC